MAQRESRYRRDERDDASLSDSPSLSLSPPPARRRNRSELHGPRVDRGDADPDADADPRARPSPRLDKDRDRDSWRDPRDRGGRRERDRGRDSPPDFSSRRQSFTDRIRHSWNARKDAMRGTPPPYPPNSSSQRRNSRAPSRRPSSAVGVPSLDNKATPLAKVRHWIDMCNAEHGDHCTGTPPASSAAGGPNGDSDLGPDLPSPDAAGESPTWFPTWLIDAVDRRLVRARAGDRYMALTYVYEPPPLSSGNATRETKRDNVEMLTASLDHAEMPQAIDDAIWLARKLGIRLLWVDRFCIVQDDDAERDEYIRNMAYVFANAYLTVVAAAGENANTGLSALVSPGGRAPPPVPKDALGPPGRQGHHDMITSSRWRERCWTMQEGFYARRALFVFDKTMTWECHCQTWNLAGDVDVADGAGAGASAGAGPTSPGAAAASKVPGLQRVLSLRGSSSAPVPRKGRNNNTHQKCAAARPRPAALGFRHAPWPDLDEYARICMDFSARRLCRVEDTTAAFRGFTTVLDKTFAGGFVFGMPVLFLDAALLWRPAATIRRRQIAPTLDSGGMNPVPSWSWMGWYYDGVSVDLTFWRAAADYMLEDGARPSNGKGGDGGRRAGEDDKGGRDQDSSARRRFRNVNGFRLRTTCQFHLTDRATTTPLRNDGMRYRAVRHARRSNGGGLPPGWSKVGGGGAFRHIVDPSATFRYPVPLVSDTPPLEMPIGGEMAYPGTLLSFNTTRAFLEVDFAAPFPERPTGGDRGGGPGFGGIPLAIGSIWAPRSGRWIGSLRSHDAWLGLQGANYESEEGRLEFVAISEGSERSIDGPTGSDVFGAAGADLKELRANAGPDGVVEFVNVLWVERVGSVCYRRGVGHIFLRAWEAFGQERVDILLG
ncbi:HET-domain-containing protein [Sodiomyces alkalinus F11]|uniref:HET-domain-containing protein n=1 Tax=Sodiomyces alkalinus (strain CBS 110278 / VKM F-3762 / F11) TaxID=1314773 RepID=A0A3N2PV40_SODAK|nr:HET-domain-containing protein [Sodiomyces alkalinus F11]ROT38348.1 HET-domain-containing protein [Sodiomyces alkalinus F11]